MPKKRQKTIGAFTGIDRRRIVAASDPASFFDALNVDLLPGGDIRARDGLIKVVDLDPRSVGLYISGGGLRTAVPAGHGIEQLQPIGVIYDPIGLSTTANTSLTRYVSVHGTTTWGTSSGIGSQPYIIVRTSTGQYEHHFIDHRPDTLNGPINTRVTTPFVSGPALIKMQGHIWSADTRFGNVYSSSTEFGPSVWDPNKAPLDAAFIAPSQYSEGDINITGLSQHGDNNLVVIFENSMQFWEVAPDPRLDSHRITYTGPGTRTFGSVTKITGDVFYFSEGGFRSLATETTVGEQRESAFGEKILELTKAFKDAESDEVTSLWSQARSQYLCSFKGDTKSDVFCFTWSPVSETAGWTRWELPIEVDYMVELNQQIFIRAGDELFVMNQTAETDGHTHPASDVDYTVITNFDNVGTRRSMKRWHFLDIVQEGTCGMNYLIDETDLSVKIAGPANITDSTPAYSLIPITSHSHSFGVEFTGKAPWRLGSFTKEFEILQGAG